MRNLRTETDSLGEVSVPADKLWGAQSQRSLEHFSIGTDLMPREMTKPNLRKICRPLGSHLDRWRQPRDRCARRLFGGWYHCHADGDVHQPGPRAVPSKSSGQR
jgi:hypothetical protein